MLSEKLLPGVQVLIYQMVTQFPGPVQFLPALWYNEETQFFDTHAYGKEHGLNTQLNRPLSIAVLQTRNGEVPGFEDLYLLTCRNTLADIRATVSDEEKAWSIFREVYKQVWTRRESLPEAGIIRPWIRVLLKEEARKQGVLIEEFSLGTDREPVKDLDEKTGSALLRIEEELELLKLPEEITGKKHTGSMSVAVLRLLFSLVGLGVAAGAAVFLLQPVRKSADALRPTEEGAPTQQAIHVEAEGETEVPEILYGWNETREGRRYRNADGSFRESSFLEDGDKLYYLDENGYAATGSQKFGNQNFVFDDDGVLKIISRSYGREQNETVLSIQMKEYGRKEEAVYIVNDSIILDGGWIYYLYNDGTDGGLPVLLRMKMESDETEMIADHVTGYTVQEQAVWYCVNNEVFRFEKETTAAAVGEGYTVEEDGGRYYLKDSYGRNVEGLGGFETINGRIYRVDDGKVTNVRPDTPKIGSYSFRLANAGKSNAVLLGDGSTYLQQGEAVDAVAVLGNSLYYSVLLQDGDDPVSQIWCVNVYEGGAGSVSGTFRGRVRNMYQFPEEDAILMDYRPGDSAYGKLGIITGKGAYVVEDSAAREKGFDSGNDQILPVWTKDGKVLCYLNDTSGTAASDGTFQIRDTKTIELDLGDRSSLGSGDFSADVSEEDSENSAEEGTVEAVPGSEEESAAELSEDEMVEEAARTVSPEDVGVRETEEDAPSDDDEEEEETEEDLSDGAVEGPDVRPETRPAAPASETVPPAPGPGTVETTAPAETISGPGAGMETVAPFPGHP